MSFFLLKHTVAWSKIDAAVPAAIGSLLVVSLFLPKAAHAADGPLRLRGDALVQTRSPVGLVVLRGEDRMRPWLDVETVTWVGGGYGAESSTPNTTSSAFGDVLTLSVRARDVSTGSEVRAGRMVVSMGAVRPVQIDGVRALGRVFGGTTVETFGGFPVAPRFSYPTFDWTAGGRLGQSIGDNNKASFGGSYAVRRRGAGNDEEVGADVALTPSPWFTAAGRTSFDIVTRAPVDALASISAQKNDKRAEIFTTHRSPGRLLPSTSLFSVLGDFAATSTGGTLRWRAYPRLELVATGSVQVQGGEVGGQGLGRTTLALDDEWAGSIGLEARRVDFHGARWTGVRTIVAFPLGRGFRAATEIELVRPDEARGRGALWPWALGAIAWRPGSASSSSSGSGSGAWEMAAAVEGSAGPEYTSSIHALGRVSYAFDRSPPPGAIR